MFMMNSEEAGESVGAHEAECWWPTCWRKASPSPLLSMNVRLPILVLPRAAFFLWVLYGPPAKARGTSLPKNLAWMLKLMTVYCKSCQKKNGATCVQLYQEINEAETWGRRPHAHVLHNKNYQRTKKLIMNFCKRLCQGHILAQSPPQPSMNLLFQG